MPQNNIFIAYAHEDRELATLVKESLDRIVEFKPYLATDYPAAGENFKERIMNAIGSCHYFIIFLTENGVKSQWVNQELGFACGVKKRKRNFRIIPISKKNVVLKGLITKDSEDLLFLDELGFDYLMLNIFTQIRNTIYGGLNRGALKVKYNCPSCVDDVGLPLILHGQIPSHDEVIRAIESDVDSWFYPCPKCQRKIFLKLSTFEYIDVIEPQVKTRDMFRERPFPIDPFRRNYKPR